MTFYGLAGLPRSGSTLLANILAQHPDAFVSGTSSLPDVFAAARQVLSNDPTVVSELVANDDMYGRYQAALRGLIEGWYSTRPERVVVDKGRPWTNLWLSVLDLYPDAKLIVTVRDPRDVIASIERQHRATALFASPVAPSLYDAAESLLEPAGLVGGPMRAIEDLLRRRPEGVLFVRYENLVVDPVLTVNRAAAFLDLDGFEFDLENIESRGGDTDEVWRGKYPHNGTGALKGGSSWTEILDPGLARLIAGVCPLYMATFSYD